jgi:hypothetical protein
MSEDSDSDYSTASENDDRTELPESLESMCDRHRAIIERIVIPCLELDSISESQLVQCHSAVRGIIVDLARKGSETVHRNNVGAADQVLATLKRIDANVDAVLPLCHEMERLLDEYFQTSIAKYEDARESQSSSARGRPRKELPLAAIFTLRNWGMTTQAIADSLGVHRHTISGRLNESGVTKVSTDDELDGLIIFAKSSIGFCSQYGISLMKGTSSCFYVLC